MGTEVEMSVTVSTGTGFAVTFDGGVGLPSGELSRGDEIRIGQDIRFVETITYVDHNTKTHIKSFTVRDEYIGAPQNAEKFTVAHGSGSRLYRRDVSKEIREALLNVPNSRIEGVSVEKIEISGDYVAKDGALADATNDGDITFTVAGWKIGDVVRVKSTVRIVKSITGTTKLTVKGKLGNSISNQRVYRAAMQKYRIKFESGCLTDDHCNHNGINSYDSDTKATCSLGGSCTCSLPSDTEQYHGFGCTRKGKGNDFHGTPRAINHARPYKRSNSGDIPLMTCDKDELFSGKILNTYGEVSKASTTKISFTSGTPVAPAADISVGNELYIDGQVRTVVEKDTNNQWVKVDLPFTIYAKSDDDFVVPAGSTVYLIHRLGGVGSMCSLTDMPKITDTDQINTDATGSLKTMSTGSGTVDGDQTLTHQTNPHTEITVRTMDPQEIEIGDRIRVDTEAAPTTNVLTPGTFITHTVDRIYYETANADSATPTQNGAIAKFTLNEIVSVELGETGNTTKVDNSANRAIYNDQRGTTENKECSGRGLCDETSGLCQCFKGYTDDDCSRQNALSAN